MDAERIRELVEETRKHDEKATEGPWHRQSAQKGAGEDNWVNAMDLHPEDEDYPWIEREIICDRLNLHYYTKGERFAKQTTEQILQDRDNLSFIAFSRQTLPALARACQELLEELERVRRREFLRGVEYAIANPSRVHELYEDEEEKD